MPAQISCASCQTKLTLPSDIGPDAKIKCPKCGMILGVPRKKILTPPASKPASAVAARPPLARPIQATPIGAYVLPTLAILVAFSSFGLPVFGQYLLGLIIACLATLLSVIGIVLLSFKRWKGAAINVTAALISSTAILVSVNAVMLQESVEKNGELLVKNERAENQAKADLDEAKKKLAEADEAPRKAEEILKKAAEAPKQAEAFFKLAKAVQEKTDAAEKRTADLLAKAEELERKNALDRKQLADDLAKIAMSEKKFKALQRDIDEKTQALATLKKEIEADKKTAADEMAALKKEIDGDRKKAEEKQKETKELLRKIEGALKGAALDLKNKNPTVRIKAANGLAKIAVLTDAKEIVGEALVEAMMDPIPAVRNAASEALEKIDPAVQSHVLTLAVSENTAVKAMAINELRQLGSKAKSAVPILLYFHHARLMEAPIGRSSTLESLTHIAPDDKRVVQILLNEIARNKQPMETADAVWQRRSNAIPLVHAVKVDAKEKVKALVAAFNDNARTLEPTASTFLGVMIIEAIERIGTDGAAEAVPLLKKLKTSTDDAVRKAATKALIALDGSK